MFRCNRTLRKFKKKVVNEINDLHYRLLQVYLSNQQEVFAYISAPATILLLESVESVMVMLAKRQSFLTHLLLAIGK